MSRERFVATCKKKSNNADPKVDYIGFKVFAFVVRKIFLKVTIPNQGKPLVRCYLSETELVIDQFLV